MTATKKDFKSPLNFFITGHGEKNEGGENASRLENRKVAKKDGEILEESHEEFFAATGADAINQRAQHDTRDTMTVYEEELPHDGEGRPRRIGPGRPKRVDGINRSKHFSLVMRPVVFEAIAKIARMEGSTPTGVINEVMEKYVATKGDLIAKHDTIFDDYGRPKI